MAPAFGYLPVSSSRNLELDHRACAMRFSRSADVGADRRVLAGGRPGPPGLLPSLLPHARCMIGTAGSGAVREMGQSPESSALPSWPLVSGPQ